MRRCDALGAISDEPGRLTRTFHSPAMQRANALVGTWMREAGLDVREDAAFNLLGRWASGGARGALGGRPRRRTLLLGSHLDTVRDAGKYDGPLGVLVALAAVGHVRASGRVLPFDVEVAGFSDEEGVRYQTAYLGSGAMAGTLTRRDLARIDEKGLERARRRRGEFLGYVETHIEQGPVLDARDVPVGVVSAIAGQSRIRVELHGRAGHAGTTPMDQREDALCGAAELVLAAEQCGVIATVGQIQVEPGASNVIPGRAVLTLDVRSPLDRRREAAVRRLHATARAIAKHRGLRLDWTPVQQTGAVPCDPALTRLLSDSVGRQGLPVLTLPSGAGHDAVALSSLCPVAMLFVRCRGGVSHHPSESVRAADVAVAIGVVVDLIESLADATFPSPSSGRGPRATGRRASMRRRRG
jgi:allantoate deiminase